MKKSTVFITFLLTAQFSFAAVAMARVPLWDNKKPQLAGRNWNLSAIEGATVENGNYVLRFIRNSDRFGIKICNQMGGRYLQDEAKLSLTDVISTQMACPDPVGATETKFKAALEKVQRAEIRGDKLLLHSDSSVVLEFVEHVALEDVRWDVSEIGGKKVVTSGDIPYIQLSNAGISGFSGCNQIFGKYESKEHKLKFSELGMTKMACTEDSVIEIENGILNALKKTDGFEIKDGALHFLSGTTVLMSLNVASN